MCLPTHDYAEVKKALLEVLRDKEPGKYYADGGLHFVEWSKEPGYYLAIYHQGGFKLHFTYRTHEVEREVAYA